MPKIEDSLMNGIEKQILYWVRSSRQDLRVGNLLLKERMTRHGLFCLHLSMAKLLKALVSKATQETAPKTCSLPILAKRANITLDSQLFSFLGMFDSFNIGILYLDDLRNIPKWRVAQGLTKEFKKVYRSLKGQL